MKWRSGQIGKSIASRRPSSRRAGSVLVGLLWCLALLSVLVVGALHTASMDLRVVKNHGDRIQAHYLALAGIEKAKALIYHDAASRKRSAQNHTGELFDSPQSFQDVPFGRGQFRIFRQSSAEEGGQLIYGISDEESRLNINYASSNELSKLYNITPQAIASIMDYRDQDNSPTPGGAEAEYYTTLQPPYLPRNGPFLTTGELLMVAGVSRESFLGEDMNQNGLLDRDEDDGDESDPPDNRDGVLDAGWSDIITVHSGVRNVNAAGETRVDVQSAEESALTGVRGITSEIAKAIIAHRGQNRFESLADLLDVRAAQQNQSGQSQNSGNNQSAPGTPPGTTPARSQSTGPTLISENLLMDIADDITVGNDSNSGLVININTAKAAVLECLPGITKELAQAIISYRESAGYFPNIAHLLKVPGINRQIFKPLAQKVSVRSDTFRILSEGKVPSSGASKRIQVIVRLGSSSFETLSYREDL